MLSQNSVSVGLVINFADLRVREVTYRENPGIFVLVLYFPKWKLKLALPISCLVP